MNPVPHTHKAFIESCLCTKPLGDLLMMLMVM
jgi:hypothetical protein